MGAKDGDDAVRQGSHRRRRPHALDRHRDRPRRVRRQQPGRRACRRSWPARCAIQGDMTKLMMAQAGARAATRADRSAPVDHRVDRRSALRPGRLVVERDGEQPARSRGRVLARLHRERLELIRRPEPSAGGRSRCPAGRAAGESSRRAAPAASRIPPLIPRCPCPTAASGPMSLSRCTSNAPDLFGQRMSDDKVPMTRRDDKIRSISSRECREPQFGHCASTRCRVLLLRRAAPASGPRPRARRPSSGRSSRSSRRADHDCDALHRAALHDEASRR